MKYDGKEMDDPIVRCTECQRLIFMEEIRDVGMCPGCGCKRVRDVRVLNDQEIAELKAKDIDPDFLAIFNPAGGA